MLPQVFSLPIRSDEWFAVHIHSSVQLALILIVPQALVLYVMICDILTMLFLFLSFFLSFCLSFIHFFPPLCCRRHFDPAQYLQIKKQHTSTYTHTQKEFVSFSTVAVREFNKTETVKDMNSACLNLCVFVCMCVCVCVPAKFSFFLSFCHFPSEERDKRS